MSISPELINQIFEVCLIPLLGLLTKFLIDFLTSKRDEAKAKTDSEIAKKYLDMLTDTVTRCVITTNQTYVDSLKKQGAFDEEAQKIAFEKTLVAVKTVLSDEAKAYIKETTGDLETFLIQMIESEVSKNKLN